MFIVKSDDAWMTDEGWEDVDIKLATRFPTVSDCMDWLKNHRPKIYEGLIYSNANYTIVEDDSTPTKSIEVTQEPTIAVNDYVCPRCKNARCGKKEKNCWRCGLIFNINKD